VYDGRVRQRLAAALGATLVACATPVAERAPDAEKAPDAGLPTARAVQLARVRCLLVAPLENASDEPLVAEAATAALVSAVDQNRTRVYPIEELRALFAHTSLELPEGVSASLALELAELVSADAVLYGSVEGRTRGPDADVTLTVRLAATGVRDTLFWRSIRVVTPPGGSLVEASRRAALAAAQPILERMGVPGRKACFERQRLDRLRVLAAAGDRPAPAVSAVTAPLPPAPPPVGPAPADEAKAPLAAAAEVVRAPAAAPAAPLEVEIVSGANVMAALRPRPQTAGEGGAAAPPAPVPAPAKPARPKLTPRQEAWAAKLVAGERFQVEDVTFAGRSARLERQEGLADLAAALTAAPGVRVRIEGFVDPGKSSREDLSASMELARAAGRRLLDLGVRRDRVTWAGRGSEAPIAPSFTTRGRMANRRVEAVVER
jgi:outer membrane protein OmpA-like peptidoglycan-associated protein